jgi:hypothetical protein
VAKKTTKAVPEEKKYPELDALAMKIAKAVCVSINTETSSIESKMPYKAQYVLEELIHILERSV